MDAQAEARRIRATYADYDQSGYTSRWTRENPGNRAMLDERERLLRDAFARHRAMPTSSTRILEIGCGEGHTLAAFTRFGAVAQRLHGVDLVPARIAQARINYPAMEWSVADATALPFSNASFDVVLVSTVFSSILDRGVREGVVGEMRRVLTANGIVVWYDVRVPNPFNRNIRPFPARAVRKMFGDFACDLRSLTVCPPVTRRLGRWTDTAYDVLRRLPPLRTHLLGVLVREPC